MLLGAVIFLLAAVVLIFLPELAQRTNQKNSEITQVLPAVASNTAQPDQVVTPALAEPVPVANPAATPVAPSESVPVVAAPASATLPTLRMVAKGVVWVEVKDSKGGLLVQRTLQPKEVVNATGTPPLSVVIGRINEIESMDVRGKPYSLAGLSPDNVARIEIK
jgi:cytoskeleton protein RodZ